MVTPLNLPRLYAILDTAAIQRRGGNALAVAEWWLEAGVRLMQFRHKGHFGRHEYAQAQRIAAQCREMDAIFVVDDRADIALLLGVGVHVGQDDLAPRDVRALLGPAAMVGLSTHNAVQLSAGETEPVDYLAIGPVFATASKSNPDPVIGLDDIRKMRRLTSRPLVAIGGITRSEAKALLSAGVDSLAVISDLIPDVCNPREVRSRAAEWISCLEDVL
ncbi:MAG TPA: thiamine phosphate synthase [Bryobacteraceae bacterium]|nr:thiamine phosphate synthase [Bryobacteraceae bacterium]